MLDIRENKERGAVIQEYKQNKMDNFKNPEACVAEELLLNKFSEAENGECSCNLKICSMCSAHVCFHFELQ